jgi:hypothetical protein
MRNSKLPQKICFKFFSYSWIEHELPRKKGFFNFQKQTFQENFQKNLNFHISLQKMLILHTYVNILLFFSLAISLNIFFPICHTKLSGKK